MGTLAIMKPTSDLNGDAGDEWMRSVSVRLTATGSGATIDLDAYAFEELMTALDIRHLSIRPRTRDVKPGAIPADRFARRIEGRWSSIDSYGLNDLAKRIETLCLDGGDLSWNLV